MKLFMRLLMILVTLLLTHPCMAKFFANKKKDSKTLVQFNNSFCKSISKNPTITVCLSGESGEGEFNEHILKALKNKTKHLVRDYKKSKRVVAAKFSTTSCGSQCTQADWDPMTCGNFCTAYPYDPSCMTPPTNPCMSGPSEICTNYCVANPADPYCMMVNPPPPPPPPPTNPCMSGPSEICTNYCVANPADPYCMMMNPPPPPPPHPCTGGASSDCLAYCGTHPQDTLCWAAYPSSCEWDDWDPYQCDPMMLGSYCDNFPSDTEHCP